MCAYISKLKRNQLNNLKNQDTIENVYFVHSIYSTYYADESGVPLKQLSSAFRAHGSQVTDHIYLLSLYIYIL